MEFDREDHWDRDPPEPLAGITLPRLALWLLTIIAADWLRLRRKG